LSINFNQNKKNYIYVIVRFIYFEA
jgi:hypothetical protein